MLKRRLRRTDDKVFQSAAEAISDIEDGVTLMSGGFGLCGNRKI